MIDPAPNAPLGSVATLSSYSVADFPLGSAILCRNNAPIVTFALGLIHRDVPVKILGKDFGETLTKLIAKLKPTDTKDLRDKVIGYLGRELNRCRTDRQRANLKDKVECLVALIRDSLTLELLASRIERLFVTTSDNSCVILATGHKAKGCEWKDVFILDKNLIPSRWAETPRDRIQERNLMYVIVTRAKLNLKYIYTGNWK